MGGVIACEHYFGGLTVKRPHKRVKNVQAKRVNGFQTIRGNVDFCGIFGQFLYGIYQFICRCAVEVARQLQAKAVAIFIDRYSEI